MGTPRRRLTTWVRKDFDPQRVYTLVMGIKGKREIRTDLDIHGTNDGKGTNEE